MRVGLGLRISGAGSANGPAIGTIEGTPISIVAAFDGDTLDDVTSYGSMTATVGSLNPVVREMQLNAGAWTAYVGSTVTTTDQVWSVRETWTSTTGATRTDASGPVTVVGAPLTAMPTLRARGTAASAATASTSHPATNPAGSVAGDLVTHVFAIAGLAGTLGSTTPDWTVTTGEDLLIATKVLNGTNDSFTAVTTSTRQSAVLSWAHSTYTLPVLVSGITSAVDFPNSPLLSFGGSKACLVISAGSCLQSSPIQTAAPTGYAQFRNQNSNTNGGSSRRLFAAEREVTGTSEDPPAWPVSTVSQFHSDVTIAIPG
jgi:hypothetical protein